MGMSEEKEQGQEELPKFRCEMLAERCPWDIQMEAPSRSTGEKIRRSDMEIRQVSVGPWGGLDLSGLV